MKKKLITGIVVVALACFGFAALAGCGGGQSSNQSSDKSNDSKTTLIVGFDSRPTRPMVSSAMTASTRASTLTWPKRSPTATAGTTRPSRSTGMRRTRCSAAVTINCIWNGFTIEGREDSYTFSEPYMLNEQVVVVKKNSGINSLSRTSRARPS